MKTLLSLGHGYSAAVFARPLLAQGWRVIGTTRNPAKAEAMRHEGVEPLVWQPGMGAAALTPALAGASHILISAAPGPAGDPFLAEARAEIITSPAQWVGYLSTTGVYGDHQGGWVDETTPTDPAPGRSAERVLAENQWLMTALPVQIFRLAGIYGPGRGPFRKLRDGSARRIIKPGQVFGRIHVEDIAQVLLASIRHPDPGAIYNVCDDEPAPPQEIIAHAARLLNLPLPPEEAFDSAKMTAMARSFYAESRRVRNRRIKEDLGVRLLYPGYREGLAAILQAEAAATRQ